MTRYLESLQRRSSVHNVEVTEGGFVIVRKAPDCRAFDGLAREVIKSAGRDYVALPFTDGAVGYARIIILLFN
ncbi:hypothetical protein [Brevundimonas nasdae]|uniref:Uncharacterized protein n=1 Tax=Brevundimonas nasdae TaxID=172043 RepID=A0ABX8THJ2_9CAUL|nr:hypothetical protein [Brevundimonas nasdae]QYC10685.1 hypothetical protein KWG56_01300 [Brevundimonas nasdae]QYC13472.1 hypothetical protein KWG63_14855 [Brevundimonas nasdae]